MAVKNTVQVTPAKKSAKETPAAWAKLPAIKFPNGIIPATVNINTLITLPLNLSSTLTCRMVFTKATAVTLDNPINIRTRIDNKYVLDNENIINEMEKTIAEDNKNLPLYLKSPRRAKIKAPAKAPKPAEDIKTPNPLIPTFKTSLANIGIRITWATPNKLTTATILIKANITRLFFMNTNPSFKSLNVLLLLSLF